MDINQRHLSGKKTSLADKTITNYIKAHIKTVVVLSTLIILMAPVAVWLAYYFGNRYGGVYTDISADGLLGYIIGAIGAIASAIVSIIAITQSNQANKMSQRLMAIEEARYKLELRPFVLVTGCSAYGMSAEDLVLQQDMAYIHVGSHGKSVTCLAIELTNTTQSFLTVKYKTAQDQDSKAMWDSSGMIKAHIGIGIESGKSKEIVFYADELFFTNSTSHTITVDLILENRFGERYSELFNITLLYYEDAFLQGLKGGDKWNAYIMAQDYRIGKYVKQYDGSMRVEYESI